MELNEAIAYVRELAGESVNIIWGTVTDNNQTEDEVVITLIATGMEEKNLEDEPFTPTIFSSETQVAKTALSHQKEVVIPSFLLDYERKNRTKRNL